MCYEFSSWHWKARAKELHKAQVKASEGARQQAASKPAEAIERKRSDVKETEKVLA